MKRLALLLLLLLVVAIPSVYAVSKQYVAPGTALVLKDSGGAGVLPLNGVGAGAGKFSDRLDKGTGSQPATWMWTCTFAFTGTGTVGQTVEVYVSLSDGTSADGGLATTNGTLATDKRRNLKFVGVVVMDSSGSNPTITGWGQAYIPTRYFSNAVWNATSIPFASSANVSSCTFQPYPVEMQ